MSCRPSSTCHINTISHTGNAQYFNFRHRRFFSRSQACYGERLQTGRHKKKNMCMTSADIERTKRPGGEWTTRQLYNVRNPSSLVTKTIFDRRMQSTVSIAITMKLIFAVSVLFGQQTLGYVVPSATYRPLRKAMDFGVSRPSPLFGKRSIDSAKILSSMSSKIDDSVDDSKHQMSLRDRLRQITGFSFTAFRTTLRGITGISLTAMYEVAFVTTSAFVRNTMKVMVGVFPTWFRYFLQPFLVLYYVPLFIVRGTLGPTGKERRAAHDHLVEGYAQAVKAAEEAQHGGYWPVHVDEDGQIVAVKPPDLDKGVSDVDVAEAVAESVEIIMNAEDEKSI